MTHQQIADWVEKETGEHVTRAAVATALYRAGLTKRVRYDEHIPWTVPVEHQHDYNLWMLRVWARTEMGLPVSDDDRRRFEPWRDRLTEAGAVIAFDPAIGFFAVERTEADKPGDLIRRPKRQRKFQGTLI
jgi:hypothetical protein